MLEVVEERKVEEEGEKENEAVEDKREKTTRLKRLIKIAVPHFGLYLFLFFYLVAGAWTFTKIEDAADRQLLKNKLTSIKSVYRQIATSLESSCGQTPHFRKRLFAKLSELSSLMEGGRPFEMDENLEADDVLPPRWTKTGAFLYSLSILTTTGYANCSPVTVLGQCGSIAYGLIGIPMMILAAVDIGRFLSILVLKVYSKYIFVYNRLCGPKKEAVLHTVDKVVNTKTVLRAKKSL